MMRTRRCNNPGHRRGAAQAVAAAAGSGQGGRRPHPASLSAHLCQTCRWSRPAAAAGVATNGASQDRRGSQACRPAGQWMQERARSPTGDAVTAASASRPCARHAWPSPRAAKPPCTLAGCTRQEEQPARGLLTCFPACPSFSAFCHAPAPSPRAGRAAPGGRMRWGRAYGGGGGGACRPASP